MHGRFVRAAIASGAALLGAACGMPGPTPNEINVADEGMRQGVAASRGVTMVALDSIEIGRALNPDNTIKDETDSFAPGDTVCASIRVSGAANSGLVRAVWFDEHDQALQDDTRIITPSRNEVVGLQASRPEGWSGGRYRVAVYLDNRLAGEESFSVEGQPAASPNQQQGAETPKPTH